MDISSKDIHNHGYYIGHVFVNKRFGKIVACEREAGIIFSFAAECASSPDSLLLSKPRVGKKNVNHQDVRDFDLPEPGPASGLGNGQ